MKQKKELFVRDKLAFNSELFCEALATNLPIYFEKLPALNTNNYNKNFHEFSQTILSTINIHVPKKKSFKGISMSIRKRRFMFKSHFLQGNNSQKLFRKYSKNLRR